MNEWSTTRILIIGKAYPEASTKHVETVCTGGITEQGDLVRMYPIPYRYLEHEKRYKLFSWVEANLAKDPSDKRKESFRVQKDSLRVLSQVRSWPERMALLKPAISDNLEDLQEQYYEDWTSLGLVQIEYEDFVMEWRAAKDVEKFKSRTAQNLLFEKRKQLDQLPLKFVLHFSCKNATRCNGHKKQLITWEYIEAFRKWAEKDDAAAAFNKLKNGIEDNFNDANKEALALVGTHSRRGTWLLAGLIHPKISGQSTMFEHF